MYVGIRVPSMAFQFIKATDKITRDCFVAAKDMSRPRRLSCANRYIHVVYGCDLWILCNTNLYSLQDEICSCYHFAGDSDVDQHRCMG